MDTQQLFDQQKVKLTDEKIQQLIDNKTPTRWSLLPKSVVYLINAQTKLSFDLVETLGVAINAAEAYHYKEYQECLDYLRVVFSRLLLEKGGNILDGIIIVAETMTFGAAKYGVNNWRTLPCEWHFDHLIQHLILLLKNDTSEPHQKHALTRCTFAIDGVLKELMKTWEV